MPSPSSCSIALKYFSADCWQWKPAALRLGLTSAARLLAASMSSSALRTHSAVRRFIQHFALLRDFVEEPIAIVRIFQTLSHLVRRANDHVQDERPLECVVDARRLIDRVAAWHDDQQIDVAFFVRRAVGVRA